MSKDLHQWGGSFTGHAMDATFTALIDEIRGGPEEVQCHELHEEHGCGRLEALDAA